MANETKVITGLVRFSYVNVFRPRENDQGKKQWSVSLLIRKSDKETLKKIKRAIEVAKERDKGKWNGKIPPNLKTPLRDGDEERPDDPAYVGHYFINANSTTRQPGIIDRHGNRIEDETEFYSGCYGRASITFYGYNTNGNRGIACGLNNLQKIKDGDPLGGFSRPEDDFADEWEDDEEDDDILD